MRNRRSNIPIYKYKCDECNLEVEKVQEMNGEPPCCCGVGMRKMPTYPAMVKIKGKGGFPSRQKWLRDWTPDSKPFK